MEKRDRQRYPSHNNNVITYMMSDLFMHGCYVFTETRLYVQHNLVGWRTEGYT